MFILIKNLPISRVVWGSEMKNRQLLWLGVGLLSLLPFQNCAQNFQVADNGSVDSSSSGNTTNSGNDGDTPNGSPSASTTTTTTMSTIPCLPAEVGNPTMEASTIASVTTLSSRGNNSGGSASPTISIKYLSSNAPNHCSQGVSVQCQRVVTNVTALNSTGDRVAVTTNNDFNCNRTPATLNPGGSVNISFRAADNDTDKQCFEGTASFDVFLRSSADTSKNSTKQRITVTFKNNCYPEKISGEAVDAFDNYGSMVAIDGDTAAILAPGDDGPTNTDTAIGAVYIYKRDANNIWSKTQVLRSIDTPIVSDRGSNNDYPNSISLKGNFLVVGSQLNSGKLGAAYIFKLDSGSFTLVKKLTGTVANGNFGGSVATDGTSIVVGAPGESTGKGAVYLFDTVAFDPITKLSSPGPNHGAFGYSVAISGNLLAVGGPGELGYTDTVKGEVYVFQNNGTWAEVISQPLRANSAKTDISVKTQTNTTTNVSLVEGAELGSSVAIFNGYILVGAPGVMSGANTVGMAFLISPDLRGIQSLTNIANGQGRFGQSVSMGSAGILVSVPENNSKRGAIDYFVANTGYYSFSRRIVSTTGAASDEFGSSVATSGNFIVVGARNEADHGNASGSVSFITNVVP